MNSKVDLLITGCRVVCFDPSETIIEDGAIAITGNTITWLGKSAEAPAAKETLRAPDTIAMPGLIFSTRSVNESISSASFIPCFPVQAFALPELTTIACARPFFTRSRHTLTGAAQIWFVVNKPATVAGTFDTISPRSRFCPLSEPLPVPIRFMSQNTPEALNPCGATIEPKISITFFVIQSRVRTSFVHE